MAFSPLSHERPITCAWSDGGWELIHIINIMDISFSTDFILLIGWERYEALKAGTAQLSIGIHEIVYFSDNRSKIEVIKDGTIKGVV